MPRRPPAASRAAEKRRGAVSRLGNEARFLNDFHGHPTATAPNCQFWPYYDGTTGERRMGIKTIQPVSAGQELLVDYGGKYFAKDEDEDSDMHDSDEEFEEQPKKKKRRLGRKSSGA